MVRILSTAVLPDILQSDNGGEFLGQCIAYLKQYFKTVHIVKGRTRKPSTQGSVERGNAPFKIALEKWIQEHPNDSWSIIGAWVVNMSLNLRLSTAKNNRSPYEAYYGKVSKATADFIVDGHLLREAETKYGQVVVQQVMHEVAEKDPNLLIKVEDLNELISQADAIWDKEDTLTNDEEH